MGFRGKQIASLTLVAATVALTTTLVNLASLARLTVAETQSRATLLAETLYYQASRVIRQNRLADISRINQYRSYGCIFGFFQNVNFLKQ